MVDPNVLKRPYERSNKAVDIVEKLEDLVKQATAEHSHYYVAATAKEAISVIQMLRADQETLAGMLASRRDSRQCTGR